MIKGDQHNLGTDTLFATRDIRELYRLYDGLLKLNGPESQIRRFGNRTVKPADAS